jgi:hypothetical protein
MATGYTGAGAKEAAAASDGRSQFSAKPIPGEHGAPGGCVAGPPGRHGPRGLGRVDGRPVQGGRAAVDGWGAGSCLMRRPATTPGRGVRPIGKCPDAAPGRGRQVYSLTPSTSLSRPSLAMAPTRRGQSVVRTDTARGPTVSPSKGRTSGEARRRSRMASSLTWSR